MCAWQAEGFASCTPCGRACLPAQVRRQACMTAGGLQQGLHLQRPLCGALLTQW
jgi:hypothetical protein